MLKFLKQIVPTNIKRKYWRYLKQKERERKLKIKFDGKSTKETFTLIHDTNYWNGEKSISGGGSDPIYTVKVVEHITDFIKDFEIKSILDLPSGDFIWMKDVELKDCNYVGADIVSDLIKSNNNKYAIKNNIEFRVLDLIKDELPYADVIINRDCLVHLCYMDILNAIKNIKKSKSKYLLTTTFVDEIQNKDITTGDWRRLNLQLSPFNFPSPIKVFNEALSIEGNQDKSLGLWLISDLPNYE